MSNSKQVRKDELEFKKIQARQHKEYKKVLLSLSQSSWEDCEYSLAIKQQAMYAAFHAIPQYRQQKVFQILAQMFEEQLEIQEEIFTAHEEWQAELMCQPDFKEEEVPNRRLKKYKQKYDDDDDDDMSVCSSNSKSTSKGKKANKNLKLFELDEPLENYVADFITSHPENDKFFNICLTLSKATMAKIVHQDCTETFMPKKHYERSIEKLIQSSDFIKKLIHMMEHDDFLECAYAESISKIVLNICCGADKILKTIPDNNIQKITIKLLGKEAPKSSKKFPEKTKHRMKAKTALVWALCEMASTNIESKNLIMENVSVLFASLSSTYLEFQKQGETDGLYWVVKLLTDVLMAHRISNEHFKTLLEHQEKVYGDFNLLYHIFEFCINSQDQDDSRVRWEAFMDSDYLVTSIEQVYFGDQEQFMDPETHGKRKKKILDHLATASQFAHSFENQKRPIDNLEYLKDNIIDLESVKEDPKEFKNMLHIIDQFAVSNPDSIGDEQLEIIVENIKSTVTPDGELFNLYFEIIRSLSIRENANTHCPKKFEVFKAINTAHKKWIFPKKAFIKPSIGHKQALELSSQFVLDYLKQNDPDTDIYAFIDSLKKYEEELSLKLRESLLPKIVANLESRNMK